MKKKILLVFLTIFFTLGLLSTNIASAYHGRYNCRWVPGHWYHGHWYHGHRVCWGGGVHCKWVRGHWRHGHWYPAQRVCWTR